MIIKATKCPACGRSDVLWNGEKGICTDCGADVKIQDSNESHDPYKTEVRRIAEILAKVGKPNLIEFYKKKNDIRYDKNISRHLEQARAMVAEMAKQYEHAYFSNYPGDEDSPEYELWNQNCIAEMKERGLIPSPTKDIEK